MKRKYRQSLFMVFMSTTIVIAGTIGLVFLVMNQSRSVEDKGVINLDCIDETVIETIRTSPETIMSYFGYCEPEIQEVIDNVQLDSSDRYLIYLTVVSYRLAPYGSSNASTLEDILAEPTLNCANYTLVIGHFVDVTKNFSDEIEIHYVGWHGGEIGNHVQVFTYNPVSDVYLLLDPTVNIVTVGSSFDDVASGKPVQEIYIFDDIYNHIEFYRENVYEALTEGLYRPSDMLYYYESLEHILSPVLSDPFITPGGLQWRSDMAQP